MVPATNKAGIESDYDFYRYARQSEKTGKRVLAKGRFYSGSTKRDDKNNVIVVSIPDYAFTPFGGGSSNISTEFYGYNAFAKIYAKEKGVVFVNITDITRQGLDNSSLVASDGLHPSQLAYSKFVERILPKALLMFQ